MTPRFPDLAIFVMMTDRQSLRGGGGHSHRRRVQSWDCGQDVVRGSTLRHFLRVGQTIKRVRWQSRGVAEHLRMRS